MHNRSTRDVMDRLHIKRQGRGRIIVNIEDCAESAINGLWEENVVKDYSEIYFRYNEENTIMRTEMNRITKAMIWTLQININRHSYTTNN